jgi:hypothetical protein
MGADGGQASRGGRKRLLLASAVGLAVVLVLAVVIFVLGDDGGESSDSSPAHINLAIPGSSTNGVAPDERQGVPPPPVHQTNLKKAVQEAECFLRVNIDYETNPPTSGHYAESRHQQADGAYRETPARIDFLNSLAHGRLEIQYALDLPEKIQLELKGLSNTMYAGTLLFPNYEMTEWAVAATTWTNLLGCPGWHGAETLDAIRAFGKATWGKYGSEPVSASELTGPTPADPKNPAPPPNAQAR